MTHPASSHHTVLLCGASGFIGRTVKAALEAAGHRVVGPGLGIDFCRDTDASAWLPRLHGVDAVVNAVGVLRDTPRRPIQAVHANGPCALFDACVQAGVRRVVQISALGIDAAPVPYAQTKLAAERHLLAHQAAGRLDGVVLRPSLVFGRGGASSAMFMTLARLPVLLAPAAMQKAQVQPVSVHDVADAVVRLLGPASTVTGRIACVGPTPLGMAEFVVRLRQQCGHAKPWQLTQPAWMTQLSVAIGDRITALPLCSDTMTLMQHDNTADPRPFTGLLGRAPRPLETLVETSWNASPAAA